MATALVVAGIIAAALQAGDEDQHDSGSEVLDEPLLGQFQWALAFINDGNGRDELSSRLAPTFLRAVPEQQFVEITEKQIRPLGPFIVAGVIEAAPTEATVRLRGRDGASHMLMIAIESDPPHRITGLLVRPEQATRADVASWEDLGTQLRALATEVSFVTAEVVNGECRPMHSIDGDRPLALGSAFKLYVLGALADEVAEDRASWDEQVALREELRVHSSARYGRFAGGTQASLRDLAHAMIAVSDNTATDHVMDRVGRDVIEAQQQVLGMERPELNTPFLTTRELTLLKWASSDDTRSRYLGGDRAERLTILSALPARDATIGSLDVSTGPQFVDTLEWFGSAADLCRAHAGLQKKDPVVRTILAANPGTSFDRERWPYVAFKGGSEPGVLCLAWLAEREDGRTFVVAAALRDRQRDVDSIKALATITAAFDLLEEARPS